jgi:CRISPR system Cascade subunit CasB
LAVGRLAHRGPWFWETFDPAAPDAQAELAALRGGVGRPPGSVPGMWRLYRAVVAGEAAPGSVAPALRAEHAALILFGLHQLTLTAPAHHAGIQPAIALRQLRPAFGFSRARIDRQVDAAATASSVEDLADRLRGLVSRLRAAAQPLDYTMLVADLYRWTDPAARQDVRRRWGAQYYAWSTVGDWPTPDAAGPVQEPA